MENIILPEILVSPIEARKEVTRYFVTSLTERNVYPIALKLHPNFIFKYGAIPAISNDLEYIGHLYKTFYDMKRWRVKISASMVYLDNGLPSVLLHPPHDRRIIFPLENRQETSLPESNILLNCTFQNDKLFSVDVVLDGFKDRIVAFEGFPY